MLLSKKAQILNKWHEARERAGYTGFQMPVNGDAHKKESQRIRWKVKADEERDSLAKMIGISLYRPFRKACLCFHSQWERLTILQTFFQLNPSYSSFRSGYLSVGLCCTCHSVPFPWSLLPITTSMLNRTAPSSQVSTHSISTDQLRRSNFVFQPCPSAPFFQQY